MKETFALFFDIDGTLVSFETHEIPLSAVEALTRAKQRGARIFIATGRTMININNINPILHLVDGYVTLNGARCIVGEKEICSYPMPKASVERAIEVCRRLDKSCVVVTKDHLAVYNPKAIVYRIFFGQLRLHWLDNEPFALRLLSEEPILQLTPFITEEEEHRLLTPLEGCVSGRWHDDFTDLTSEKADKGLGLLAVARYLGLDPRFTMAFGDGGNDIPMVRRAGIGVAMGNGREDLKAVADYVTTDVDHDGISVALRHFGIIP